MLGRHLATEHTWTLGSAAAEVVLGSSTLVVLLGTLVGTGCSLFLAASSAGSAASGLRLAAPGTTTTGEALTTAAELIVTAARRELLTSLLKASGLTDTADC